MVLMVVVRARDVHTIYQRREYGAIRHTGDQWLMRFATI
jgi:hypothetical protein